MAATSGPATGTGTGTLVYLVRHGRTPLNESDDLRGVLDPPLDVCQRQAGWLGISPQRLMTGPGPTTRPVSTQACLSASRLPS
jgi:hypothetical protein